MPARARRARTRARRVRVVDRGVVPRRGANSRQFAASEAWSVTIWMLTPDLAIGGLAQRA
jgi:hypothetical protein